MAVYGVVCGAVWCGAVCAHGDDSHRACSFQRPGSDEGYRLAPTGCVSCSSFGVCVSPSSGRSEMEFGRNGAICGPQQRSFLVYIPTRSRVPHFRAIWAQARLSCQCAFVEPNSRSASTNFCGPLAPGTRLYRDANTIETTTALPRCDVRARAATKVLIAHRANPTRAVHPRCRVSEAGKNRERPAHHERGLLLSFGRH